MNMITVLLVATLASTAAAPAAEPHGAEMRASADVVREAGVAMYRWVVGQLPGGEPTSEQIVQAAVGVAPSAYAWEGCSEIAAQELALLLGTEAGARLPTKDAWGHELQFCLTFDRSDPSAYLMAVRSPGRDGKFATDPYEVGGFPVDEADQDIVWVQGVFVRWPTW